MKIDLCKLLGVEEGEEFKRDDSKIYYKYRVYNNIIQHFDEVLKIWEYSTLSINALVASEIIKLPKKKEFTDNELCILRNIDKKYKWMAKDKDGLICTFVSKPIKTEKLWSDGWSNSNNGESYASLEVIKNSLFTEIKWEDDEPIYIDDYVDRK